MVKSITTEEILTLIQEECGELVQACAKAHRFGLSSCHPETKPTTNIETIIRECIDVCAVIDMLIRDMDPKMFEDLKQVKIDKVLLWHKKKGKMKK